MSEKDIDALVASTNFNVFYTSDVYPFSQSYTLLPLENSIDPVLITSIYGTTPVVLMSPPWFSDVRYYGEFYIETNFAQEPLEEEERLQILAHKSWEKTKEKDPMLLLAKTLEERGITKGRLGIDDFQRGLINGDWEKLRKLLPKIELVESKDLFTSIKMIKTSEEVNRIKQAVSITTRALDTAFEHLKIGMTERDFAAIFNREVFSQGGEILPFKRFYGTPISFGKRSAYCDIAQPSDYRLHKGDIIRYDGGCGFKGYEADMARTAVIEEPNRKLKRYWNAINEGVQIAAEMVKPGVEVSEIFKEVMNKVRSCGINHFRRHHVGHGLGLNGYDPPLISPSETRKIEENMVLCLETPYYEVGWGGVQVEDIVKVTRDSCEYLTRKENELRVIC